MCIKWLSDLRGYPLGTQAEFGTLYLFFQWLLQGEFEDLYGILLLVYMVDCIIAICTNLTDSLIDSDIHDFLFWLENQARSSYTTHSVVIYLITVSELIRWQSKDTDTFTGPRFILAQK